MFWLSYECFSILCNAFLLKSAISSHNSCGLGSGFIIYEKKLFFVLGVAHEDPIFAQVGPKNSNFQRFQQNFLRTTGFQLKFLILIEFPNIVHWKPAKKIKLGVVLGQNLGQIMSNVVKKVKKQVISLGFFHILLGITF